VCERLAEMPVPVVALVHGVCYGGAMEVISFCDFVVADPDARFGVPEISLAFFPPYACYQFPRIAGDQNAAYLVLTGKAVSAQQAQAMGFVQQIENRENWSAWIDHFNRLSLPVLRLAKKALQQGKGKIQKDRIGVLTQLFLEELYRIDDVKEGIRSFQEKRRPEWKHR